MTSPSREQEELSVGWVALAAVNVVTVESRSFIYDAGSPAHHMAGFRDTAGMKVARINTPKAEVFRWSTLSAMGCAVVCILSGAPAYNSTFRCEPAGVCLTCGELSKDRVFWWG